MTLNNLSPGLVIPDELLSLTTSTVSNANKLNQNMVSNVNSIQPPMGYSSLNSNTLNLNLVPPTPIQLTHPTPFDSKTKTNL